MVLLKATIRNQTLTGISMSMPAGEMLQRPSGIPIVR